MTELAESTALSLLLPFFAALVLSMVCSMGGVSGAFLLVPLQMLLLGGAGPEVSANSHLFNVLATPGGVFRHARAGRLLWPLALPLCAGSVTGLAAGVRLRTNWLADGAAFPIFAALLLLLIAAGMARSLARGARTQNRAPVEGIGAESVSLSPARLVLRFSDRTCTVGVPALLAMSLAVGIAGGAYGIGGGSLVSPLLAAAFGLPVRAIAGAALFSTFCTSAAALPLYGMRLAETGGVAADWTLGIVLGLGGMIGIW
ncbi:MAG: TSUP family transporter, partial [Desulfovibrionaceae bacterium]|nr:TSUP family transporter [Desulfovibrionaceae bacterium]